MNERMCKRCGRETWSPHSPYCRDHRPSFEQRQFWAAKTRDQCGYGSAHKALRARYACLVEAGEAICARCRRPIFPCEPGTSATSTAIGAGTRALSIDAANRHAGAKQGAAITKPVPPPRR